MTLLAQSSDVRVWQAEFDLHQARAKHSLVRILRAG